MVWRVLAPHCYPGTHPEAPLPAGTLNYKIAFWGQQLWDTRPRGLFCVQAGHPPLASRVGENSVSQRVLLTSPQSCPLPAAGHEALNCCRSASHPPTAPQPPSHTQKVEGDRGHQIGSSLKAWVVVPMGVAPPAPPLTACPLHAGRPFLDFANVCSVVRPQLSLHPFHRQ